MLLVGLELPREELYDRINLRVDRMIGEGLVDEAKTLYPMRDLNGLNTVGYRELFAMFDGSYDLDEAIRLIKRNTRHYAKRQITWNKRYPQIKYFHPEAMNQMLEWINQQLNAGGKTL
jgi:tRNA dimethylallyltransferase